MTAPLHPPHTDAAHWARISLISPGCLATALAEVALYHGSHLGRQVVSILDPHQRPAIARRQVLILLFGCFAERQRFPHSAGNPWFN